jgi:hypothetical protein
MSFEVFLLSCSFLLYDTLEAGYIFTNIRSPDTLFAELLRTSCVQQHTFLTRLNVFPLRLVAQPGARLCFQH